MNRCVSAFFAPDCPGRADVARFPFRPVVAAFAVRPPDGMNWRQIQHVEAELRQLGNSPFDVAKRPVLPGTRSGGARKQLIPRRETRSHTIDDDDKLFCITCGTRAICMASNDFLQRLIEESVDGRLCRERARDGFAIFSGRDALQRLREEHSALLQLELDVLTGITLFPCLCEPSRPTIGPAFDRISPATDPIEWER